jgi:uncharacterized short protein YbdD (DUF466 family)
MVVLSMVVFGFRSAMAGWRSGRPTATEATTAAGLNLSPATRRLARRPLGERLRRFTKRLGECGCPMVGVPDHENYVAHVARAHPDQASMTYKEFFRERRAARYGDGGARGMGCC